MFSTFSLGGRGRASWLKRTSPISSLGRSPKEAEKKEKTSKEGRRYRAQVSGTDASQSAQLVRSWLYQVAQDYESIQEETTFLRDENSRLRSRLDELREELQVAQDHSREMEIGDAIEARLMSPARLPPVRGSDYGGGALKFATWSSMVSLLDEEDEEAIRFSHVESTAHVADFGAALDSTDLEADDLETTADDLEATDHEAGVTGSANIFPLWFQAGQDLKPQIEMKEKVNQTEEELALWFQSQDMREDEHPHQYIFSPVGGFRIVWDLIWSGVLLIDFWLVSFIIAFLPDAPCHFLFLYDCVSVYLMIDIALGFMTGLQKGSSIIWEPIPIARSYLKFWFWMDFIAAIPWVNVACFQSAETRPIANARHLLLLRLLRFIRFFKFFFKLREHDRNSGRAEGFAMHLLPSQRTPSQDNTRPDVGWFASLQVAIRKQLNHVMILHSQQQSMPIFVILLSCLLMHLQACIWGYLHEEWGRNDDPHAAFQRYRQSLFWSYMSFIAGSGYLQQERMYHGLECIVAFERSVVICLFGLWLIFQGLIMYDEDAHLMIHKADALEYLQRRGVSVDLQSQVLSSFNQTRRVRKLHHRFEILVDKQLSYELRHMIYEELWGTRLKTLGLIGEMSQWHQDFLGRLSELVSEEAHASKAVLCRSGDWASAAYYILEGEVHIISGLDAEQEIPDFTHGMWVGEKALVHTGFRRSNSIVTHTPSTLMVVPTVVFHDLINELNLRERFQLFCTDELWRGLCGRCGRMGDHFSDECPTLSKAVRSQLRMSRQNDRTSITQKPISRELRMFLVEQGMAFLEPTLKELGISTLEDLETANRQHLKAVAEQQDDCMNLTVQDFDKISPASIKKFREMTRGAAQCMLQPKDRRDQHFIFLSHYKLEAGTEASLMRFELEQLLSTDTGGPYENMDVPVFLDSEDLQDLADLQRRVRLSHNIALILTQGVLSRPWVLVEIVTAVDAGIQILPVQIFKLGNVFEFPSEEFYMSLKNGLLLGDEGMQLITDCGYTIDQVVSALQLTFKRIATPYSPHRPASIRVSELEELLRLCRFRPDTDRFDSMQQAASMDSCAGGSNALPKYYASPEGGGGSVSLAVAPTSSFKKKADPFKRNQTLGRTRSLQSESPTRARNNTREIARESMAKTRSLPRNNSDESEASPLLVREQPKK